MTTISFTEAVLDITNHRRFQVHLYFCYNGDFPRDTLFPKHDNWEEYDLTPEDSSLRYVVWSKFPQSVDDLCFEVSKTLTLACSQPEILASAAMFDCAYGGYDGLYCEEIANQVYGAGGFQNGPVFTFDRSVMLTATWCRLIVEIREKNLERIRQLNEV